jgi:hypothetical protein
LIIPRSLLVVTLALFLSVASATPTFSRSNWDTATQISGSSTPLTAETYTDTSAKEQSWFKGELSVTFDELMVAAAAIATTFATAAGSIALFVPPEAQLAVFTGLIIVAATPIDGVIIGGGAIAAYRYFRDETVDADLEVFAPSWIDRWTYVPN